MNATTWDVFISYATQDQAWVEILAENLQELGLRVFFDKWEVGPGEVVSLRLDDGLQHSRCGVIVISPDALHRPWVREEYVALLEGAVQRDQLLVPLLYRDTSTVPPMLRTRRWIDFRGKVDNDYFAALDELARALSRQPPRRPLPGQGLRSPSLEILRDHASLRLDVDEPVAVRTYRQWLAQREATVDMIGVAGGEMKLGLDALYVALRAAPGDHRASMPGSDGLRAHDRSRSSRVQQRGEVKVDSAGATITQMVIVQGSAHFGCVDDDDDPPRSEPPTIDVAAIFRDLPTRHALLLGHPGSGKTTALQKLLYRVRDDAPAMGLAAGTVPVWLPLRRFAGVEGRSLGAWIGDELAIADKDRPLDRELGAELWKYGRILLLADGLDEVAVEAQRARLCAYLHEALLPAKEARTIVSSRYTGYRGGVRLSAAFTPFDLQPLDDHQVEELVTRWFAEAPKAMPSIDPGTARARGIKLCEALRGPLFIDQRRAVMKSTPLLLTLVCVIVNSGRDMPESRVAFYEECLKVMLSRWGKASQRWIEPPLDPTTATAVVQRLAYTLHSADKRDDLPLATLVREAGKRLKELRKPPEQARESIQWLLERSGILREFGVGHLGFFHLGMQEYLAAAYVGEVRGPLLDTVVRALGDSWWHELTRLMVALPSAGMFEALVARLLALDRGWTRHIELIGRWIDESPAAGAAPFIAHLQQQPAPPEEETLAILGILDRFVEDDAVHALAAALSTAKSPAEIKLRAKRLQDRHREQTQQRSTATDLSKNPRARPLALLFREDQRATAEQIAVDLATQGGHELLRGEQGRLEAAETLCGERLYAVCERAAGIVVIANARGAAFVDDPAYADALGVWANEGIQIFGACTSGEIPRWPEDLAGEAALSPWVDLRSGSFMELRIQILRSQDRRGSASGAAVPTLITRGAVFIEPVTEIRFLGVPGGRFRMGQKGVPRAEPVRWVRLSPYWLAETPVTNLQYQRFLEANPKQEKPVFWEDERFAGPSRPVIGVSWEDAVAFCTWLSGQPVLRAANLKALLPSEAQWEFAARSDDERPYPWGKARPNERPFLLGKARPNERLAVFGRKDKGTFTAPVGSCPDGAGPFGHLDLAGNVWEWCRDVWDEQAYVRRQEDALDPVNEQGDPDMRPFRGDCWHSDELWAAAVRSGVRSWFRSNYDGFRVGVEPASR